MMMEDKSMNESSGHSLGSGSRRNGPDRFASSHNIPHFATNGSALTQEERASIAKRKGLCLCGTKTHTISIFKRAPLTNENVHKGVCIKCNPTSVSVASVLPEDRDHRNPIRGLKLTREEKQANQKEKNGREDAAKLSGGANHHSAAATHPTLNNNSTTRSHQLSSSHNRGLRRTLEEKKAKAAKGTGVRGDAATVGANAVSTESNSSNGTVGAKAVSGGSRFQKKEGKRQAFRKQLHDSSSRVTDITVPSEHLDRSSQSLLSSQSIPATVVEETAEVRYLEAEEVKADPGEAANGKTIRLVGFGSCLLMIIVAAVVTTVTLIATSKDEQQAKTRPELIQEMLLEHRVLDSNQLRDTGSAAFKAQDWIVNQDRLQLDPGDEKHRAKIVQRFILALFYLCTTEDEKRKWKTCDPPETGESQACQHELLESYGVEGEYFNQYMLENALRWMSKGDECSWAGVHCGDGENVTELWLGGYEISGSLPVELMSLPHLKILDLQQNKLGSSLPPEFGTRGHSQNQLEVIRLDRNKFEGPLPDEWCLLAKDSLTELNLGGNQLTGTLPSCLGGLLALKDFSVMNNMLSGTIPEELSGCTSIERFHFAYNNFVGSVPVSICNAAFLTEVSTDCLDMNPVECYCCTKCCDSDKDVCKLTGLANTKNGDA